MRLHSPWLMLLALALTISACSPEPRTDDDPFAYCAAVRNVDRPGAGYTGPQVPDAVINAFKQAAGLQSSTEPMDMLRKTTIWRCMDGKVYACNFGANLPCDSKADINKTPTQEITDYCTANPGASFIPMSVTGHATVYDWHCVQGKPQAGDQVAPVDASGYLANIWYPLEPGP